MNTNTIKSNIKSFVKSVKDIFNTPIATPETDPTFFGSLQFLPNPDPILREIGQADEVYRSIMADAHVLGEVRSIRGSFRQLKWRINSGATAGTEDARAKAAQELCQHWMATTPPNDINDWLEVMWQMTGAIFTGYRPHELVWDTVGSNILPVQVLDRPGRRFKFDRDGQPLLVTRDNYMGSPLEHPYQFVISRHSASVDNPYGVALLSSCFWAWTFKTGGWRYLVKFCERHGLPWPIARYPQGTSDKDIGDLQEALSAMLENAYGVVPDGTGVELIEAKSSGGTLPQVELINMANREISKALTGQAMIAELHNVGARAATETAAKRQEGIHESDRDIAASSMNKIFQWITLFNFGADVAPPKLEFFKQEAASKERAETYEVAVRLGANPSASALLEELNIPKAKDASDELKSSQQPEKTIPIQANAKQAGGFFSRFLGSTVGGAETRTFTGSGSKFARELELDDAAIANRAVLGVSEWISESMFNPALTMLSEYEAAGKTLAEFETDFGQLVGMDDGEAIRQLTEGAIQLSFLQGVAQAALETKLETTVKP